MQRRSVAVANSPSDSPFPASRQSLSDKKDSRRPPSTASGFSTVCLVIVAAILTLLTYFSSGPSSKEAANVVDQAYKVEQELEREMTEYWQGPGAIKPPVHEALHPHLVDMDPSERMKLHSSKWVDGEKKLKKALQVLKDRQEQGLDLGLPVLTRWLGEDIPAFVTKDKEEEWKKTVADEYVRMRKEEEEWRKEISAKLFDDNRAV
jgi:hypothetical protein